MKGLGSMYSRHSDRKNESGQALVLFVLVLVAVTAMTGLVLDGGGAFAQRRQQQKVADLAAMAGAIALANTGSTGSASSRAQDVAAANGYSNGSAATEVNVSFPGAGRVRVTVGRPHPNAFASVVGQNSWDVETTATAMSGFPNAAYGAMPILFNKRAFNNGYPTNTEPPGMLYGLPPNHVDEGCEKDVPCDDSSFNWTIYCTANGNSCNGNSSGIREIINQNGIPTVVDLGDDIGPLNFGNHTDLFAAMNRWIGAEFPVSIVDDEGNMVGWATFHLTSIEGSSDKVMGGYFVSPINPSSLTIVPGGGTGDGYGSYVIRLDE